MGAIVFEFMLVQGQSPVTVIELIVISHNNAITERDS